MSLPPTRFRPGLTGVAAVVAVFLAPARVGDGVAPAASGPSPVHVVVVSGPPAPGRPVGKPVELPGGQRVDGQLEGSGEGPWGSVDAQVAQALERARALRAAEREQAATLPQALAAVRAAADDSTLALTAYRAAAEAQRQAVIDLAGAETALARAEADVAAQRAELARWVRAAYLDAGALAASPAAYTLLAGGTTDDVVTRRTWLERISVRQNRTAAGLRAAVDQRHRVTDAAQRAGAAADAAVARARTARTARDTVLAAQRRRLGDLELALAATRRSADDAGSVAARLAADHLAADHLDAARRATGLTGLTSDPGRDPTGECPGGDVSRYGNGRIPRSALCPLPGTFGELLRSDAASAFVGLDAAFAARFGRSLCVTDGYRSYDEQVRVRAERPGLAAVPGHSNHGWGTAADLCGGVDRFGTPEHEWMRLNAPLFGWFHPVWARAGGSLPEAWHWEFSG